MLVKKKLLNITLIIRCFEKKENNVYRTLSEEEKEVRRLYSKDRYSIFKEKLS